MTTQDQTAKLTDAMSKESLNKLQEYRGNVAILKNQYRNAAFRQDPMNSTIYEQSTFTKADITNCKRSVTGVNHIAQKAEAAGLKEGQSILDKFATHYADKVSEDAQGLDPFKSFADYNNFDQAVPTSVKQAEQVANSEAEQARVDARVGTTEPAPGSKAFGYADNFANKDAVINLVKTCIPCTFRSLKLSVEFGMAWGSVLDDLKKKWEDLKKMLHDLLALKTGEFSKDFCNLFKFLDGQCLPDILGLLSLLSMMQLKYMDMGSLSLGNIAAQLLAPFLSPIIGAFTTNLDKYADMILGPLKCIIAALQLQMQNLQTQINGAVNIADKNTVMYRQKEIDFYDAKAKSLRNRLRVIEQQLATVPPDKQNTYKQARTITSPSVGTITLIGSDSTWTKSLNDEKAIYDKDGNLKGGILYDLQKLDNQRKAAQEDIKASSNYSAPANFNSAMTLTRQSQFALDNMGKAYKSILQDLIDAINDGIGMVRQSIDIYREEFQRLLLGRISTQQDQLEYMRMIQQISRLVSIVNAVNDFKKAGFNLKKFCEQGGSDQALAQVAKQMKASGTDATGGNYDFYSATDADGNPLIVIAPGGAKVTVNSIEMTDPGTDNLVGDGLVNPILTQKSVSFNDLNEVDKMNREGVVPSLGNIDSKMITLDNGYKPGSELDLHFKSSYAIISNEFCSKSAISFGSSDTVKQWANTLWQ